MQAILLAGDRGYSKAVRGRSKAFLDVAGKPMLVHVLEALLHTPEVSEVFVVGDAARVEKAVSSYGCLQLAAVRGRPVHIVPQRNTLYENIWHTFLRTLPGGHEDPDHPVLVVPADIPLVVPEELSDFTRQALATGLDYVVGLTPHEVLQRYEPGDDGDGVVMASFNVAEGRYRQNNLHLVRPLRMGNRHYIQDMYENRYQKELGSTIRLAGRVVRKEFRNLWVLSYYVLMHLAGLFDRHGFERAANVVRRRVGLRGVERGIGALLQTRFTTVVTGLGGAALDVDNADDLEVVGKNLERWKAYQTRLVRAGVSLNRAS